MFILFAILFVAAIGAIIYGIAYLLRKYVKFYKSELEKEKLVAEVEKLNVELYHAYEEKARVLGLQVDSLGVQRPASLEEEEAKSNKDEASNLGEDIRFPRMTAVDRKYEQLSAHVELPPDAKNITLEEICVRFRNYAASQHHLYYTLDTIRCLFASMGTGKIVILEGISGTGKTSLPYCMGRFFQNPAAICSVQPSWRDRSELLGFYNEFTHKFTETEFLRAVYEATYREDPQLIVLDEMNLARIEYYFAEFLSIMEMPNVSEWKIDIITQPWPNDPKHLKEGTLLIPQNIWFVGTANNDDSTFTITDKVYDRAMSIFFDNKGIAFDCDFTESLPLPYEYLAKLFAQAEANFPISQTTVKKFDELDSFVIDKFQLAFGNRILKQMKSFVPCYVACGGTELGAVDYIFAMKILKKFEVLNIAFLRDELIELDNKLTKLFGKNEFQRSKAKIKLLLKMNS